jgi:hypothetical protein
MNVYALGGVVIVAAILGLSLLIGARLGKLGRTPERRRDVLVTYAVVFVGLGVLTIPLSQGWEPDSLGIVVLTGVILAVLRGALWLVRMDD